MKELFRVVKQLARLVSRGDRSKYVLLLALMIFGALLEAVMIGTIPAFVTVVSEPSRLNAVPMIGARLPVLPREVTFEVVLWASGLLVLFLVAKGAILWGVFYYQAWLVEYQGVKLSDRMFRAYMEAPYEVHLQRSSAELLRNVNLDTQQIVNGLLLPVLNVILNSCMTLFIATVLMLAAPNAAVLSLAIVGLGGALIILAAHRRMVGLGVVATDERRQSVKAIQQGLGAVVDARIAGVESHLTDVYRESLQRMARALRVRQVVNSATPYLLETIAVIGLVSVIVIFVAAGTRVDSIVPLIALLAVASVRLRQTAAAIAAGVNMINFSKAALPHIVKDVEHFDRVRQRMEARQVPGRIEGFSELRLESVGFTYAGSHAADLRNVSLNVASGESIAFVGPSGCGKSTLVNLILGLLEPGEGTIRVNGHDILTDLLGWRHQVGYIPQFIYLLDDTIRANVAFGVAAGSIDDQQVWKALATARLDVFVKTLPDGLETTVGERGVRLSGGQRQRLGIARAIFRDPKVLIMDEATSALDTQTEEEVMEAIRNVRLNRTFIMVAHRLSTIEDCDRIYLMRAGEIDSVRPRDTPQSGLKEPPHTDVPQDSIA